MNISGSKAEITANTAAPVAIPEWLEVSNKADIQLIPEWTLETWAEKIDYLNGIDEYATGASIRVHKDGKLGLCYNGYLWIVAPDVDSFDDGLKAFVLGVMVARNEIED